MSLNVRALAPVLLVALSAALSACGGGGGSSSSSSSASAPVVAAGDSAAAATSTAVPVTPADPASPTALSASEPVVNSAASTTSAASGSASTSSVSSPVTAPVVNSSVPLATISGQPALTVIAGSLYQFTPVINVAGAHSQLTVTNLPSWATFNSTTGAISGTPQASSVGIYPNISIKVSNAVTSASLAPFSIGVQAGKATAPVISGTPATTVIAGANYSFRPTVTSATGQTLTFTVANLPNWAKFDTTTGTLSGTPATANEGAYANIIISVADSGGGAALASFSINVTSGGTSVATITWTPPTLASQAGDDVAGYRVYYGTSVAGMTRYITVSDPNLTSYVLNGLTSGTWYFAIASYDAKQTQSALSSVVTVSL